MGQVRGAAMTGLIVSAGTPGQMRRVNGRLLVPALGYRGIDWVEIHFGLFMSVSRCAVSKSSRHRRTVGVDRC